MYFWFPWYLMCLPEILCVLSVIISVLYTFWLFSVYFMCVPFILIFLCYHLQAQISDSNFFDNSVKNLYTKIKCQASFMFLWLSLKICCISIIKNCLCEVTFIRLSNTWNSDVSRNRSSPVTDPVTDQTWI